MRRDDALRSGWIRVAPNFRGRTSRNLLLAAVAACIAACANLEGEGEGDQSIALAEPSWFYGAVDAGGDTAGPDERSPVEVQPRAEPEQAEDDAVLRDAKRMIAGLAKRAGWTELRDHSLAASTPGPTDTRYFVQIGSHQVLSGAEGQLEMTRLRLGPALENLELRVRPFQISDQPRFFRVQIGPLPTQVAATDLCRALKSRQQECFALADKAQRPTSSQDRAEIPGGWASIGPAGSQMTTAGNREENAPDARAATQIAETLPLYTAPGLPGVLQ